MICKKRSIGLQCAMVFNETTNYDFILLSKAASSWHIQLN